MPLPQQNTPWPPREWKQILHDMDKWAAWWTGDTSRLWDSYHRDEPTPTPHRRGVRGMADRMFWGRHTSSTPNRPSRGDLHVPMAADLCATSADLLYSTPPTITGLNTVTLDRVERYVDDGLWEQMLTGAETGAALGGRYHRVTWDTQVLNDRPFITTVDADSALPEFRWGHLVAVTFWTVVARNGNTVRRHLERHELDANGNGVTLHGLYEGTADNLGRLAPLTDDPATAPLALTIREDHTLDSGLTPGLSVAYVPNVTPQRRWRKDTLGHDLGRSDLDGIEPLMDALDEVYSSWMRDIRLGKARVFADRSILITDLGPGITGPAFDLDQEIYAPLDGLSGSMKDGLPIQPQQFAIRVAEHEQTAQALTRLIIRGARYSTATFGDDVQDTDVTATEVKARQSSTDSTRGRKIRLEKPALQALLVKLIRTDQAMFNTPGLDVEHMTVTFQPLVQETTAGNAQTAATLKSAGLLSREVGVRMVHPDWDDSEVQAEVQALLNEAPLTSPDQWKTDPARMPEELTSREDDRD